MNRKIPNFENNPSESNSSRHEHFVPSESMERAQNSLEDFEYCKTTGPILINCGKSCKVCISRPDKSEVRRVRSLIEELDLIRPNDSLCFFSQDLGNHLFLDEDASTADKKLKQQGILEKTNKYFFKLLDSCIASNPDNNSILCGKDGSFLRRLISGLKKDIIKLKHDGKNENNETNNPDEINSKRDLSRVDNIIRMRIDGKMTFNEIARRLNITRYTVSRIFKQYRSFGLEFFTQPSPPPQNKIITRDILNSVRQYVKNRRGLVSGNLVKKFIKENFNIEISKMTANRVLKNYLNLRRRVGGTYIPWINIPRCKHARFQFVSKFIELVEKGFVPISVDETGFQYSSFNSRVWVEPGFTSPKSHSMNRPRWNLILAVAADGLISCQVDLGNVNQVRFIYFLQNLFEKLKTMREKHGKFYFLIFDNLAMHKTALVKALITKYAIPIIFIPPYSSFLQPVELVHHVLKVSLDYNQFLTWYFS